MIASSGTMKIEEIVDPAELESSSAREAAFRRNLLWFETHAKEIGGRCAGKCICIAGEELFFADTPEEALSLARAAHPRDEGFFVHYIHKEKSPRIYAPSRNLADM